MVKAPNCQHSNFEQAGLKKGTKYVVVSCIRRTQAVAKTRSSSLRQGAKALSALLCHLRRRQFKRRLQLNHRSMKKMKICLNSKRLWQCCKKLICNLFLRADLWAFKQIPELAYKQI